MSSTNASAPDSSHTSSSAGTHPTRAPSSQEQKMIDDILLNYQLKPSHQTYSHYAEDAVFHDPVSIAKGKESIMAQFNGMPRLFAESVTERKCGGRGCFLPEDAVWRRATSTDIANFYSFPDYGLSPTAHLKSSSST